MNSNPIESSSIAPYNDSSSCSEPITDSQPGWAEQGKDAAVFFAYNPEETEARVWSVVQPRVQSVERLYTTDMGLAVQALLEDSCMYHLLDPNGTVLQTKTYPVDAPQPNGQFPSPQWFRLDEAEHALRLYDQDDRPVREIALPQTERQPVAVSPDFGLALWTDGADKSELALYDLIGEQTLRALTTAALGYDGWACTWVEFLTDEVARLVLMRNAVNQTLLVRLPDFEAAYAAEGYWNAQALDGRRILLVPLAGGHSEGAEQGRPARLLTWDGAAYQAVDTDLQGESLAVRPAPGGRYLLAQETSMGEDRTAVSFAVYETERLQEVWRATVTVENTQLDALRAALSPDGGTIYCVEDTGAICTIQPKTGASAPGKT